MEPPRALVPLALSAALVGYAGTVLAGFFLDASLAAGLSPVFYLNQYAVNTLQVEYAPGASGPGALGVAAGAGKQVYIAVAPGYGNTFDLTHFREQRAYFAPGVTRTITESPRVGDDEVVLLEGPCDPNTARPARSLVACETGDHFVCPRGYRGRLAVYY